MTAPQELSEEVSKRPFRKDVLLYVLAFLAVLLIELGMALQIGNALELKGLNEDLAGGGTFVMPEAPSHLVQAILMAALAGLAVSLVVGVWTIKAIGDAISHRVRTEGSLITRQGSLFQDFGLVLLLTFWVAAFFGVRKLCDPIIPLDESHEAFGRVSCYLVGNSALAFLGGLTIGLLAWVYFWAVRYEHETQSQILLTRYSSKKWSTLQLLGIGVIVLAFIVFVFYRLFTLE